VNGVAPGFITTAMTSRHYLHEDGSIDEDARFAAVEPMRLMSPLGLVGEPLDIAYIKTEILLVLLAGADTTGTVMQGLMHELLIRPEIYRRLMEELDGVTRKGWLSQIPQYAEVLEHCPYYIACIREVMRCWPSASGYFPRVVDAQGIDFYGKLAPPGTEVTVHPSLIHRDKKLYGPDADQFNPDRWLDLEQSKKFLKYFFGFGYGARVCLGKDIALMEIYKAPLQVCKL